MLSRLIGRPLLALSFVLAVGVSAGLAQAQPHLTQPPTGTASRISDAAEGLERASRLDPPPARPIAPGVATSLELLNRLRAEAGVPPLRLSTSMSDVALAWSTEMSRSGFRHSGGPYGENIAWASDDSLRPDDAAALCHDMWVDSAGHYANMTDPSYTEVGIGFFVTPGGWWATHVFR